MEKAVHFRTGVRIFVSLAGLVVLLAGAASAQEGGQSVYENGLFQLGDGQPPPGFPGVANIVLDPDQPGIDWEVLFLADRSLRDERDALGQAGGNGVPDHQELYGGQWAVFAADDVSLGSGRDTTVLTGDGRVQRGTVAPEHDLGNAYVYTTFDDAGNLILYAGAERLGGGDSSIEFEFNQGHVRLGHGPPWEITGGRGPGDVLVRLTLRGGSLASLEVETWKEIAPGEFGFQNLRTLPGEGCEPGGRACVICNASTIDGGPWPNFDTAGDPEQISAQRFLEFGVNVGGLLGFQPDYTSLQIRTPQDVGFGYFAEGN